MLQSAHPMHILSNFDLSVIMPFYKKLAEFKKVLEKNCRYFQRNGIEVIILMDEPTEQGGLLTLLNKYPLINWKVFVNYNMHEWRNPSKPLNVGIRHASKKYCLVLSPESEFYSDVILIMRTSLEHYKNHFVIGRVSFLELDATINNIHDLFFLPYGSIMVETKYLKAVGGYNEGYDKWGGDDDNLRARLEYHGIKKLYVPDAILLHREPLGLINQKLSSSPRIHKRDSPYSESKSIASVRDIHNSFQLQRNVLYPASGIVNDQDWGRDFNDLVFSYENRSNAYLLCKEYLEGFKSFKIYREKSFVEKRRVIALVRSYNCVNTISASLSHLDQHSDGIILLDDDSTDGTYEKAYSEKLIVKVQKTKQEFSDAQLYNILLDIASFLRSEWFYFIDDDERFSSNNESVFEAIQNTEADTILFNFVHVWETPTSYNQSYPFSKNGIQLKFKMFKNIGRMQNLSTKKLHVHAVPYYGKVYESKVLVIHQGHLKKEDRERKYKHYLAIDKDKDQVDYSHLVSPYFILGDVEKLKL